MQNKKDYTIEELLNVAQQCEQCEEFDMALKYYRETLKKQPKQSCAIMGVERTMNQLAKTVYFRSEANLKLTTGRLELRKGMIVFVSDMGVETEYDIEQIENPRIKLGRLVFDYEGSPIEGYSCSVAKKWVSVIEDVLEGRYPVLDNATLNAVEKYICDNYTLDTIDDAVDYFIGISGCDYSDARIVVRRVLSRI